MEANTLYYGDCLEWMEKWNDEVVDLIYLDPPFNSNANYNMLYSRETTNAQYRAFNDTWTWDEAADERYKMYSNAVGRPAHKVIVGLHHFLGDSGMLAYLTYMARRLEEMHRLLKPTGSIYLHCDPTASHYLKLILDEIFGKENFRNEIIWHYYNGTSNIKKAYVRKHDVILFYARAVAYTRYNEGYAREPYATDSNFVKNPGAYKDTYKPHPKGKRRHDVWRIPTINNMAKERLGYPTQKPLKLLHTIISASSNEGDLVLDPFCGCGTTVDAAQRSNRKWVGIDISSFAIDLIKNKRLKNSKIPTQGIPHGLDSARKLASENPFNFESWAITRLQGFIPNTKQVGDRGIDGRAKLAHCPDQTEQENSVHNRAKKSKLALAQVKGGGFTLSALRDFIHVVNRDDAVVGVFITLDSVTSKEARKEVAKTGKVFVDGYEYPRVQMWSIQDYFNNKLPRLPIMTDPYTGKIMRQKDLFHQAN